MSNSVQCSECAGNLEVPSDVMQGEILVCGDCGVELEVMQLEPLTIELAPMELEDWGE